MYIFISLVKLHKILMRDDGCAFWFEDILAMCAVGNDIYLVFGIRLEVVFLSFEICCSVRILCHIDSLMVEWLIRVIVVFIHHDVEMRQCRLCVRVWRSVTVCTFLLVEHKHDIAIILTCSAFTFFNRRWLTCGQDQCHHYY